MKLIHSLTFIVGSTFLITGGTYKGMRLFYRQTTSQDYLCRILQTGPQREALKTTYLAQQMKISADRPILLSQFNTSVAERRLLASPVIRGAHVKLLSPDTLYVDYTVRQPIAWLYDFENIALDEDGYPFPVFPFFTPKKLPEIYLGIQNFYWNRPLKLKQARLALVFLSLFEKLPLHLRRLDVSNAFHSSLGRREIVVILDEQGSTKFLRLTPKNFAQELGNYLQLRPELPPTLQTIDLRISQLAFIKDGKSMQASEP